MGLPPAKGPAACWPSAWPPLDTAALLRPSLQVSATLEMLELRLGKLQLELDDKVRYARQQRAERCVGCGVGGWVQSGQREGAGTELSRVGPGNVSVGRSVNCETCGCELTCEWHCVLLVVAAPCGEPSLVC